MNRGGKEDGNEACVCWTNQADRGDHLRSIGFSVVLNVSFVLMTVCAKNWRTKLLTIRLPVTFASSAYPCQFGMVTALLGKWWPGDGRVSWRGRLLPRLQAQLLASRAVRPRKPARRPPPPRMLLQMYWRKPS